MSPPPAAPPPAPPPPPAPSEDELFEPARILVDSWPPDYGPSYEPDEDLGPAEIDLGVEVPAGRWTPRDPAADTRPAADVVFVDGVQRADARITLVPAAGDEAVVGVAGSFAAGAVRCRPGRADIGDLQVVRGLFSRAQSVHLDCGPGVRYLPYMVADARIDRLNLAMTERMRGLERSIALAAGDAEMVVVDGPLSGGRVARGMIGFIKTHRRHLLPDTHRRHVAALAPGQRTPLFGTRSGYTRFSWYLRLPGPAVHPWAGVVRLELPNDVPLNAAVRIADVAAATLPRFASEPHRDPRAPQNLVPIGGLEQELRHRLGDKLLLERLLRRTCAGYAAGSSTTKQAPPPDAGS